MSIQAGIEAKLRASLAPSHLQVVNESHMHSVPPGSESHFKVVVVSERFAGVARVRRHQMINEILRDELATLIHALSMRTLTAGEWAAQDGQTLDSPPCHGGGKHDTGTANR
ncbi:MAG TPA: BolA/IbaG family iron-sulfur metabolism protein [Kiloniellales bacterium]|jgi:BolA protein